MSTRGSRKHAVGHGRTIRALRLLWWGISLGILLWWMGATVWDALGGHSPAVRDERLFHAAMALISFPAGLIWVLATPWLLSLVPQGAGPVASLPYAEPFLVWLGCAVIGYVQWFWLLPQAFSLGRESL